MYESKLWEFPWIPDILFFSLNQRHTYLMIIFQEWPLKVTFFHLKLWQLWQFWGTVWSRTQIPKQHWHYILVLLDVHSLYMLIFNFLIILMFIFYHAWVHYFKRLSSKWKSKTKTIISKSVTRRSLHTLRMRDTTLSDIIITKTLGWYYFLPFYRWDWGSEKLNNLL